MSSIVPNSLHSVFTSVLTSYTSSHCTLLPVGTEIIKVGELLKAATTAFSRSLLVSAHVASFPITMGMLSVLASTSKRLIPFCGILLEKWSAFTSVSPLPVFFLNPVQLDFHPHCSIEIVLKVSIDLWPHCTFSTAFHIVVYSPLNSFFSLLYFYQIHFPGFLSCFSNSVFSAISYVFDLWILECLK